MFLGIRHHRRRLTCARVDLHNGPASRAKAKKTRRSRIAPVERNRERESMKPLVWLPWEKRRLKREDRCQRCAIGRVSSWGFIWQSRLPLPANSRADYCRHPRLQSTPAAVPLKRSPGRRGLRAPPSFLPLPLPRSPTPAPQRQSLLHPHRDSAGPVALRLPTDGASLSFIYFAPLLSSSLPVHPVHIPGVSFDQVSTAIDTFLTCPPPTNTSTRRHHTFARTD